MSDWAIETASLRKIYGRKEAVADLTLAVGRGEVFGFLGPNGAGKSTAVKMLLGLVFPSGGAARILGRPPGDAEAMARIGFLPEHFRFHEWLNAAELLDVHGRLYGLSPAYLRQRIPALLQTVGLGDQAARPLSGFSKGMLQRVGLAQALLPDPELVFLDEPTSALDPFGRLLVRRIIHDLKDRGATVFLNSHLLSEVEATCDRVAFIRDGRVLRTLSLSGADLQRTVVDLEVDTVTPALAAALDRLTISWRRPGGGDDRITAGNDAGRSRLELTVAEETAVPSIADAVVGSGARLYALTPHRASLEEAFLEIVGQEDSGQ